MTAQKLLLRLVLFCLAAAAVCGAVGVLLAQRQVVFEVVGSLILTSICAAGLLWASRQMGDAQRQWAGMFATVLVALEFVLGLSLVWDVVSLASREKAGELMLALFGAGVPAIVFLRLLTHRSGRIAGWVGLVLAASVFCLWMLAIVNPSGKWDDNWILFGDANVVGGIGAVAVCALVGAGTDRRYWRWIGVGASVAACAYAIQSLANYDAKPQPLGMLISLAVIIAHANLALRAPLRPAQRWLAFATILAMCAAGLFFNLALADNNATRSPVTPYQRLTGAWAILAGCGSLALIILTRINKKILPVASKEIGASQVTMVCPVCQRKMIGGNGVTACEGCGLRVHIRLEEPRCAACGYSLLMLKSNKCPECGAAVSASAGGESPMLAEFAPAPE